jgi:hypothetical protein
VEFDPPKELVVVGPHRRISGTRTAALDTQDATVERGVMRVEEDLRILRACRVIRILGKMGPRRVPQAT